VIRKALEKKRQDRFASAEDFDQQIVSIQRRLGASDLERTRAPGAAGRPAGARDSTPSAQSRLDEHFALGTTPLPSDRNLAMAPTVSATGSMGPAPAGGLPRAPHRPWSGRSCAAAVALAAVILRSMAASHAIEPSARPEVAADAARGRSGHRRAEESPPPAAVAVPTEEPAPRPCRRKSPAPTPPPSAESTIRSAARAPRPTPRLVRAGSASHVRAGRRACWRGRARRRSRAAPTRIPTAPVPIAPSAASSSATPGRAGSRLPDRETIRRYEKARARSTQLYARITSVDRDRIERAFQSLVPVGQFEVRKIQIDQSGTRARVDGFGARGARRHGQRVSADRVLELEKRAEGWVIVRLN
jgi:hypothetical protein